MIDSTAPTYLDYNATAPLLPELAERMRALEALPLNPSSVHHYGRLAKKHTEEARRSLAHFLGVWPDEIVFTASATEANNMALHALPGYRLIVAASEHSSILAPARARADSVILPVDSRGIVSLTALERALQETGPKALVSVMLANNETGVIQPVAEIAKLVHAHGALLHSDAVQAFVKHRFDFNMLGVDMLTVAAHKAGGPVGVGALIVKNSLHLQPLLRGGGQEKGRRAGTENVPAIAGFGWLAENPPSLEHLSGWRERIEAAVTGFCPEAKIAGQGGERLSNTLCLSMPGISNETQLMHFDLAGICVSAGSACSSGRIEPSHVLQAMGWSKEEAACAIRLSLGWATREQDVDAFIAQWKLLYERLGRREAA